MVRRVVVGALASILIGLASPARANLDFFIFPSNAAHQRYEIADLVDIAPSTGFLPAPNTSPYEIVRVITTRTVDEVRSYLERGNSKRRAYYLDKAKMSAQDRAYFDANRVIQATETTALSWITRKQGQ